jgi:hypothetical protein
MAIRHTFPLSHVITHTSVAKEIRKVMNSRGAEMKDGVIIFNLSPRVLTVRGVRPSRSVIRHERGGFNG